MSSKFMTILIALDHAIVRRIDPTHLHENAIETMSIVSSWRNNLL
ncbi:hypothetical protein RGQ29_002503 [Quercus rubra]|uniref:Uncharacterized protein n=1 Tax=Quercus rubra TaxID=3512 RepID=A0AAN7I9Y3_QUERU|nr:hypothetical protein RGQ29_002503 [Quercus rubra]